MLFDHIFHLAGSNSTCSRARIATGVARSTFTTSATLPSFSTVITDDRIISTCRLFSTREARFSNFANTSSSEAKHCSLPRCASTRSFNTLPSFRWTLTRAMYRCFGPIAVTSGSWINVTFSGECDAFRITDAFFGEFVNKYIIGEQQGRDHKGHIELRIGEPARLIFPIRVLHHDLAAVHHDLVDLARLKVAFLLDVTKASSAVCVLAADE